MLFAVPDINPEFTDTDSMVSLSNLPEARTSLSKSVPPRFSDGLLSGCASQRRG